MGKKKLRALLKTTGKLPKSRSPHFPRLLDLALFENTRKAVAASERSDFLRHVNQRSAISGSASLSHSHLQGCRINSFGLDGFIDSIRLLRGPKSRGSGVGVLSHKRKGKDNRGESEHMAERNSLRIFIRDLNFTYVRRRPRPKQDTCVRGTANRSQARLKF